MLGAPLNIHVLTALEQEPMPLMDLRRAVGSPPQTTMRKHMNAFTQLGVIERHRQSDFPGAVDYELTDAGQQLISVAKVLRTWLASAPDGSMEPGSMSAKSAVKALVDGWSSMIIRALAARPLSLTELNRLISTLNYPSLERRLGAMRLAGQITVCKNGGRGRPYAVTPWLRRAMAPLVASAAWERRFAGSGRGPVTRLDVESAFLLAVPLIRLSPDLSGTVRLAVEIRAAGGEEAPAGVLVRVEEGEIVSCVAQLRGAADAWATGSVHAWLAATTQGELDALELGGDGELTRGLIERLQGTLLAVPQGA